MRAFRRNIIAAACLTSAVSGIVAFPGVQDLIAGAPASSTDGSEWPFLGGNSAQWQFSPLKTINDGNVGQLGLAWSVDLPVVDGLVGNPIVRGGIVYQAAPGGVILANDVRTGKQLWTFQPEPVDRTGYSFSALWATHFTRGLSVDENNAYVASGDCRLMAVNRKTGLLAWEAAACDPKKYYGIVGAPRIGGGKVFIGNTNTEMGTERGYVDAYDAATGKHLWRFYTVPGDPAKGFENEAMEMASKTWGTDYWKKGVGSGNVWESITYDDKLDRVYLGVGNPAPNPHEKRVSDAGEELFSNSIVALDARTGKYLWHYHTTSPDGFDGDAVGNISMVDLPIDGKSRRVLIQASKNGYFYVLDPETGKLLSAKNYVPNNWVQSIDPQTGKMTIKPEMKYWEHPEKDHLLQPGFMGARSWTLMAYNPDTRLAYIPAFVWPRIMPGKKPGAEKPVPEIYLGDNAEYRTEGKLIAWDPVAQREVWHADQPLPLNGGVLTTAGNLVFQGSVDGKFNAYAARDGRKLWSYDVKGAVLAAPATVQIGGEQFVLVPVGDGGANPSAQVYARFVSNPEYESPSRLLAFKIGGKGTLAQGTPLEPLPRPFRPRQPEALAAKGQALYYGNGCWACHGFNTEKRGKGIPDLRRASKDTFDMMPDIVIRGAFAQTGMPSFPHITDEDITAIQAFITNQAWEGYDRQKK